MAWAPSSHPSGRTLKRRALAAAAAAAVCLRQQQRHNQQRAAAHVFLMSPKRVEPQCCGKARRHVHQQLSARPLQQRAAMGRRRGPQWHRRHRRKRAPLVNNSVSVQLIVAHTTPNCVDPHAPSSIDARSSHERLHRKITRCIFCEYLPPVQRCFRVPRRISPRRAHGIPRRVESRRSARRDGAEIRSSG